MARMHSKGKGASGSSKPNSGNLPDWSETDKSAIEELIISMAKDGHTTAMIGTVSYTHLTLPTILLV